MVSGYAGSSARTFAFSLLEGLFKAVFEAFEAAFLGAFKGFFLLAILGKTDCLIG